MGELAEVRGLLDRLGAMRDRLTVPDKRYIESWGLYLRRRGDSAMIGRFRLAALQKTAQAYGVATDVTDAAMLPGFD